MVLSLVWYKILPPDFGGQKGIAIFSRYLAKHIPLTVLCSKNNTLTREEPFRVEPLLPVSKMQFIDPTSWKTVEQTFQQTGSKVLLLEHCYYGWLGTWMKRKHKCPLIVHSHNIEYERFREMGKWWWRLLYMIEKKAHRNADLSLFKTEEDQAFAQKRFSLDPAKCMVVPYGLERTAVPETNERREASQQLRQQYGIPENKKILLFNGTLDYAPNAEALEHIVEDIIPMLGSGFVVVVCGRIVDNNYQYLKNLVAPGYIYAGYVDNIESYFLGADVFINPVNKGGGVKVKVMEALSYGLPVVSYVSGSTGINKDLTGEQLVVVADGDVAGFVHAVQSVNYRSSISEAFFEHYHWNDITRRVAERIRQLAPE